MRKTIFVLVLLISTNVYSQKIKGFGTISAYLAAGSFQKSTYGNLGIGLEYNLNTWVRPEVEATIFFGALQNSEDIDFATGFITDKYYRSFTAENLCLSPKFTIDISNDLEKISLFQIIPRFNFTRIQAEEKHYNLNSKKTDYDLADSDKVIEFRQSIGIAIGFYIELSDKKSDAMSFNLYYNNIDFGNALSNLRHSKSSIHTNQVLGAGVNYYFGFVKKKK